MRIFQALSVFFQVLFNRDFASQVQQLGITPDPAAMKVEDAGKNPATRPKPRCGTMRLHCWRPCSAKQDLSIL